MELPSLKMRERKTNVEIPKKVFHTPTKIYLARVMSPHLPQ
jgi:hypothetical protein